MLLRASPERSTVGRLKVRDAEAEGAAVIAMGIARPPLAEVEEKEGVALAELPPGVYWVPVRFAHFEFRAEGVFVELDGLLEAHHANVDGDRAELPDRLHGHSLLRW